MGEGWLFEIMGSLPPKPPETAEDVGRHTYRTNVTVHVVADSLEKALFLFAREYGGAAVVAMIAEGMDLPADLLDPGTYAPTSTAESLDMSAINAKLRAVEEAAGIDPGTFRLVWKKVEPLIPDWPDQALLDLQLRRDLAIARIGASLDIPPGVLRPGKDRRARHAAVLHAAGKLTWTDDLREAVRVITFDGTDTESPYLLFETEIGAYCRVQILSGVVGDALGADWLISDLFVPKALRGAGVGTLVLSTVLAEADRFEVVCLLGAAQSGGEMSQEQLVEWYRKFGFEPVSAVAKPVMRRSAFRGAGGVDA